MENELKIQSRNTDRRQQNVPVKNDYRSGIDRRAPKISQSFFCALEAIPTFRRTATVSDKIDNGDYLPTAGILGYTLVNIKEDIRDTVSAGKQIYSKINPNYHYDSIYDRKDYQHNFSATRGLVGEKLLYKKASNGNPFAQKIIEAGNTTLDDTRFGRKINKIFKVTEIEAKKIDKIRNINGKCAKAYKFESSILAGKTIARAMKRTTKLGIAVLGVLELPKIASETTKGDNFFEHIKNGAKQTLKSAGNVALTTAGIAVGGAIGAQYLGATGSLIGMGIGAIAANKASTRLHKVMC